MSLHDYLILPALALAAMALDWLLGEPRRFHALVGFGSLANILEEKLNLVSRRNSISHRVNGAWALILLLVPFTALAWWLCCLPSVGWLANILFLYFAVGHKSLHEHAYAVSNALQLEDDGYGAREAE